MASNREDSETMTRKEQQEPNRNGSSARNEQQEPTISVIALESQQEPTISVIALGSPRVGKTALVRAFMDESCLCEIEDVCTKYQTILQVRPTVSINAAVLDPTLDLLPLPSPIDISLNSPIDHDASAKAINQLASQLSFFSGALLVYDICNSSSFEDIRFWINMLKVHCPDAVLMLVGNKSDLAKKGLRQVEKASAERLAIENGCIFYETSAVNEINVDLCFTSLFSVLSRRHSPRDRFIQTTRAAAGFSITFPPSPPMDDDDGHPYPNSFFTQIDLEQSLQSLELSNTIGESSSSPTTTIPQPQSEMQNSTRNEDYESSMNSMWNKTVDMLDWLIPASPSDDEFSEDEEEVDYMMPALNNYSSKKRRRSRFSTSRLIRSVRLAPFQVERSSSLIEFIEQDGKL